MNKLTLLYLFLPLLAFTGLYGQVTIGADKTPVGGAILDLKQKDAADGGVTSGLGMMLPRVNLINLQPTKATGANSLPVSIGAAASENWDLSAHTGLTVYNVKISVQCDAVLIPRGVYTWTGTEWRYLGQEDTNSLSPDVHEFTDPRDGEKYLYRTFGTAGEWMLENLRYIPDAADGYPDYTESVQSLRDESLNKYYTFVVPDDILYDSSTARTVWESGYKRYGIRYNYCAAINVGDGSGITVTFPTGDEGGSSTQPVRRGVCPPGWHVPSDYEWMQLTDEIRANTTAYANPGLPIEGVQRLACAMTSACDSVGYGTPTANGLTARQGGFAALRAGMVYDGVLQDLTRRWSFVTSSVHRVYRMEQCYYVHVDGQSLCSTSSPSVYASITFGRSVRCKKDTP